MALHGQASIGRGRSGPEGSYRLVVQELDSSRKAQKDEEKEAWRFLILAASAPLAVLTLQGDKAEKATLGVDLALLLMGASIVSLAIAGYAFWLFLCVGRRQLYSEDTETRINKLASDNLLLWETHWNAYTTKNVQTAIGILFTAIFYSLFLTPLAASWYAWTKERPLWLIGFFLLLVVVLSGPLICFFVTIVKQELKIREANKRDRKRMLRP